MNFDKFLPKLKSSDDFVVEETIDEIGTIIEDEPKGEVRELLLKYCHHNDPYIRRVALRATAMHWSFPEAFEILVSMLTGGEEHDEVLDVACPAIGCYSGNNIITDGQINELYVKALENKKLSEEHRKMIYCSFLKYHDLIDIREYAAANLKDGKEMNVDMDVVYNKVSEIKG